jgi:glycosyltransferase involved in cell wall biosynthesis
MTNGSTFVTPSRRCAVDHPVRILIVNDGFGDAGGVQNYLDAVAGGLLRRRHDLAILHRDRIPAPFAAAPTQSLPQFTIALDGLEPTIDRLRAWRPDVCFAHNMNILAVDRRLLDLWPVVKFMHGYSGTCISGQKRFGFPIARPCDRRFGPACLALYGPRHCGELNVASFIDHYRWAREQHDLLNRYRAIVVASDHMKEEYVKHGVDAAHVHVNPLFSTHRARPAAATGRPLTVAFAGRMTVLKGGDLLVDAIAVAAKRLRQRIELLLIGDGPQRPIWEALAAERGVPVRSLGWITGDDRWIALSQATLLAVPSTWPEPFGLVGLEAGALGVPAVAFDVGGIRQWLRPGVNGALVPADPPTAEAFADALASLLADPNELAAMGARARAVADEMSLERHLDRLEPILGVESHVHAHSACR